MGGGFDARVAVSTVDTQLTGVQRVAVRYRLRRHVSDVGRLRRRSVGDQEDDVRRHDHSRHTDRILDAVGPLWEEEGVDAASP